MATTSSHNKKSSSVKRILSEARELSSDISTEYTAAPLEDNIFEWHFTLRGPSGSEFADGLYHGRILLPAEYPMRPPNLMILTPNGRWELNKKICLTFTGFHEEMWQPAWGIRTALLGIQTFMTARAEAAVGIGALDYSVDVREKLAKESRSWTCPTCQLTNSQLLPDADASSESRKVETLPEGLTIDATASSKAQAKENVAAAPSGQAVDHATVATTVSTVSPSISSTAVIDPPTSSSSSSSRVIEEAARPVPTRTLPFPAESRTSTGTAATTTIVSNRPDTAGATFPSERKLVLLDRCITLLVCLVALLIIKRLI